ncbi:tpd1 protein -like 1 [Nicotiana attenuata]|uniref:Tpd1 protein -like 1 n=1 Tax=Nicotiana attenuata TaxID=49451 RepID=A0A1J6HYH2_NICAT|nr:tpd1 protein -like 1 [Nicotiana attenuata]
MKCLFMVYVALLLVSFSVMHINHALELAENGGAIQERALIPRQKYTVTSARKLLRLPGIGDGDGTSDDGTGDNGDGNGNGDGGDDGTGNGDGGNGDGGDDGGDQGDGSENRIGPSSCSKDSIQVNQGDTAPLPNGIPTYTVIIENACYSGGSCTVSNIHLSCGWFSSARLINPRIFRRLSYNDCLVNDGEPLNPGQSLTFQYANTFKYPLSVSSIAC